MQCSYQTADQLTSVGETNDGQIGHKNLNQLPALPVQAYLKIADDALAFDNAFAFDNADSAFAFDNEWA